MTEININTNEEPSVLQKPYQYKIWALVSVLLSCALLISLSINFSHPKTKYISQTLALPELTTEPSSPEETEEEENTGWKTITAHKGDTLGRIFKREKLSQQTLLAILHANPYAKNITNIKPNQSFQILVHDDILEKMIYHCHRPRLLIRNRCAHEDS